MPSSKRAKSKTTPKYFTPQQANAMLPLLRSILRDVTDLAHELHDRQESIQNSRASNATLTPSHREEMVQMEAEFERGRDRMHDYLDELQKLGIELKDPFAGLVDFRSKMDGREVYLCWRMDESEVAHWHELDKGYACRQKLMAAAGTN
jgi:hypothetical protein